MVLLSDEDHVLLLEFACLQEILDLDIARMHEHSLVEFVDTLTGRQVVWGMGMTRLEVLAAASGMRRILNPVPRVTLAHRVATTTSYDYRNRF